MALTDTLKEKAGPLPVWAWGAILGLVVVAGMWWYSSRGTTSSASATGTTEAYPELGEGSMTAASGGGSSTDTTSSLPDFASNLAWQTFAIARMTAQGYSPLEVQAALEAYLNGDELTASQAEIVNYVVGKYGSPPNGTNGVSPITSRPVQGVAANTVNLSGSVLEKIGNSLGGTTATVDQAASKLAQVPILVGSNGNVYTESSPTSSTVIAANGKSSSQLEAEKASNMYVPFDAAISAAYDSAIRAAKAAGR